MKKIFLFLWATICIVFVMSCNTTEKGNEESIVSEPELYIAPGEQMYKLEITPGPHDYDVAFIATLRPVSLTKEDWPVLTFAIEKDTLTITENEQVLSTPVNPDGNNKYFYQKMKNILTRNNLDIIVPKQFQRFFLIDGDGVVREIIENSPDITYLSKVVLVVNPHEDGVHLNVYKGNKSSQSNQEMSILKGYIPNRGFLLLKNSDMKDIVRIDLGNETHVIKKRGVSALQQSVNKLYNAPINYQKFLKTNSSGKVFKANAKGGSIQVSRFGGVNNIYIPPNEVIVYFGRSGDEAEPGDNVTSYVEIVVF